MLKATVLLTVIIIFAQISFLCSKFPFFVPNFLSLFQISFDCCNVKAFANANIGNFTVESGSDDEDDEI